MERCSSCGYLFKNISTHVRKSRLCQKFPFMRSSCRLCGKEFSNLRAIEGHLCPRMKSGEEVEEDFVDDLLSLFFNKLKTGNEEDLIALYNFMGGKSASRILKTNIPKRLFINNTETKKAKKKIPKFNSSFMIERKEINIEDNHVKICKSMISGFISKILKHEDITLQMNLILNSLDKFNNEIKLEECLHELFSLVSEYIWASDRILSQMNSYLKVLAKHAPTSNITKEFCLEKIKCEEIPEYDNSIDLIYYFVGRLTTYYSYVDIRYFLTNVIIKSEYITWQNVSSNEYEERDFFNREPVLLNYCFFVNGIFQPYLSDFVKSLCDGMLDVLTRLYRSIHYSITGTYDRNDDFISNPFLSTTGITIISNINYVKDFRQVLFFIQNGIREYHEIKKGDEKYNNNFDIDAYTITEYEEFLRAPQNEIELSSFLFDNES